MKHVTSISVQKPLKAEEVAWIQLKDLLPFKGAPLDPQQSLWLSMQLDNYLQK